MSRKGRAATFLFEPMRFYRDPKVMAMSVPARGVYAMLFCAGWELPEPGVYPNDDRVLAQLAMCSPREWSKLKAEVASAFEVQPDVWVQKGLVRTRQAQVDYLDGQAEAGRKAASNKRARQPAGTLPPNGADDARLP